jgi:NAD(P)-dependent dehydrogenase (short-subunit alcohol dehydrogenase family)
VELSERTVVVTGAASGIGRAMCLRFARESPRGIVAADLDAGGAGAVAEEIIASGGNALSVRTDVSVEADVAALVARAESFAGPVDLFCSNAGVAVGGGAEASDADWELSWRVNVMGHVYAARHLLPLMLERGSGYLLNTASAAGLLTNLGTAPYSVTKHGAVALAEWLSITHGDAGIKISCLCPQGVRTPMLLSGLGTAGEGADHEASMGGSAVLASGGMLEPEEVAEAVVAGLREERFLILPHPEVAAYFKQRADDHERWLRGMRRLQARVAAGIAGPGQR